ncbi:glycosyltransferase [Aquabacterium olei]|nr:glycosyltransferase [Aquabacterium olei]
MAVKAKDMSLRILHVISSVNPSGGGPIEGLKRMAAEHRAHGRTVEVACLDDPGADWVKEFPLKCHALGPGYIGNYRYSGAMTAWLKANRTRYDVVFVNGIWQYHAFAVWRALHGTDTPYFVFIHGMLDPWFKRRYPIKHLKKWLFWPWSEYRVLRDARSVLFTCENERLLARQSFWLYQCREAVVNYGTDAPPEEYEKQVRAFREGFPALVGKRQLLFLGRVHEKKGADLLFHAIARIRGASPELIEGIQIVMAGPNAHAYGSQMRQLTIDLRIADMVTWVGMVAGDMKWGAFKSASAFILPSHQENFGIAVAEAMACGVPVLISDQVNIWREIVSSGSGFVEPDSIDGTERLVRRWLETPEMEWRAMGQRARQCFQNQFTISRSVQSVINIYEASKAGDIKLGAVCHD